MHALWKGAISFGLVHIPVRMYLATAQKELQFKLLHKKDLSELRYARICKAEEIEVPWEEVVKGIEDKKGHYVVLEKKDFEKASLKKSRTIEILDFTQEAQVDPIYYDTPYYLEPEKEAGSAYALLREALKASKKVAVGRFVFHNHEHIGLIRVYNNVLVLHKLRYFNEIRSEKDVQVPKSSVAKAQMQLALKLIDELSESFDPKKYFDAYKKELKTIIQKKGRGQKIKLEPPSEKRTPKVQHLASLLEQSLRTRKKRRAA